jgi:hypothetical protein
MTAATTVVAALAGLGACTPMAGSGGAGPSGAALTAGSALSGQPVSNGVATTAQPAASLPNRRNDSRQGRGDSQTSNGGMQDIVVGGASDYHVTLKMMPPAQVCDAEAFVDGVRAGYVATWNGLVAASGGAAARRPVFEPAPVAPLDARYRLQWNGGPEPANACAAYGYQIGKVMGTRQAYIDARGAS